MDHQLAGPSGSGERVGGGPAGLPAPAAPPLYVAPEQISPWPAPVVVVNPSDPVPPVDSEARRVLLVELAVMTFLVAIPSLVIGLEGLGSSQQIETDLSYLELAAIVLGGFGPAVLCGFLLWRDRLHRRSVLAPRSVGFTIGWGSLCLACIVGAVIVGGMIIYAIQQGLGSDAERNLRGDTDLTVRYVIVALLLSLTAGVTEEYIFRGYAVVRFEQVGCARWAFVVPSALWVLLHLYGGPYTLIGVAFIGAPLVWIAWWKRSVWPAVFAHFVWDVFAFLIATVDQPEAVIALLP